MSLLRLRPALNIAVRQMMSSAASSFTPSDDAGLALWLRAPTTSYVTGTTQAVDVDPLSSWLDSVGAKSFAQATAGNRPRYCVLETVPTVRFAGPNRTKAITYANKVFGNNTDFTVSLAFRRAQRNTVLGTLYSECNSAATNALFAIVINTAGSITVQMRDNAGAIVQLAATTRVDDNKIHVVTVTILSGNVICYIDGNLEFSTNYAATVTGWATATFDRTTLGARTSTTVNTFMMCDIYEVVGYTPSISGATLTSHNNYLVSKYAGAIPAREVCGNANGSGLYSQAVYSLTTNKTYIGAGNSNASPQVTVINHGVTPNTKLTYVIDDNIGTDRHNSCAIAFDSSGRILAFYDDHNNGFLWINKSTNVDDPTAWGTKVDIGPGTMHAYVHAIKTTEGAASWRIYVFYRDQSVGSWNYRLCDNTHLALASMTWAAPVVLWQPQGAVNVQIYGRPRMCADGNIHFFFGDDDVDAIGGHTDLYHFMYKPSAAKFYKSDGTTEITSPPFDATDATLVYDSSAHGNRHIQFTGDIMTSGSNIYITASTKDPSLTNGRRLVRLVYSSGAWALDEIMSLASAQDVAFKPGDPNTLYYAENDGTNLQQYKIVNSAGVWGSPVVLTSGDHFTTVTQGAFRVVDAELGGPIDIGYQWGHYADSTTPYGHLLTYPAAA